ncbi:zinc-dependent alcohol dehydrogenase [Actinomycetospora chiangmaiensis]|uniref:zinc-dependent alcohol dehydrogenase n=1 Tax=Actinomycetospora chiangmaiensis TaxID=402650 RepID=UPI0003737440|nr:alcohol dehydrogenase catalytic domain-containing protein [Actinomycetospora chiangmaiensis]
MRALEFTAELEARVVDAPAPAPGPGEVLVAITSAGVCGSDVSALRGTHPFRRPPLITGHEGGGRVVEVGPDVEPGWVGRQVALEPQRACGACGPCGEGLVHLCRNRLMLGMPGWTGTLAEYVTAPLACLHPVADEVPDGLLALAEPLAVAHHAQGRAPHLAGTRVGVLGGGPIGALQVVTAIEAGGEVAVVTDPRAHCREAALALGAAEAVEPDDADRFAGTLDVVFVAAAAPGLVDQAVALVTPRGTVVQVGLFAGPVEVDVLALQQDEKTLTGAIVYTADDVAAAVRTLERSWRDLGALATDVGSLDAVADYLHAVLDGRGPDVIKVLTRPDGGPLAVGA